MATSTAPPASLQTVVAALSRAIEGLEQTAEPNKAQLAEMTQLVLQLKSIVCAKTTAPADPAIAATPVLLQEHTLKSLLFHMPTLDPTARSWVGQVWVSVLRCKECSAAVVEYIRNNCEILLLLLKGYEHEATAFVHGAILRAALKHESILFLVLFSPLVWRFFDLIGQDTYTVVQDVFSTFKAMLTRSSEPHKRHVAAFLSRSFEKFFARFKKLLESRQYVLKRQSTKLLSEILQERLNFKVMLKFIARPENLELIIDNLSHKDGKQIGIQFESFHVFKFFVANPRKPAPIIEALKRHRAMLLETLQGMAKQEGVEYGRELPLLLDKLRNLK